MVMTAEEDTFPPYAFLHLCLYKCLHVSIRVHVHVRAPIPHCTHLPQSTHLPAWPAPGSQWMYTEAVDGEVLHNHVHPLTSRAHHTKSPLLHLPDVNLKAIRSGALCKDCWPFMGSYTHKTCMYTHTCAHMHTSVCSLAS